MAETEEYVYHAPDVKGRTFASGWEGKPMYRNDLKTIGDDGYVASNILLRWAARATGRSPRSTATARSSSTTRTDLRASCRENRDRTCASA